MTNWPTKKLGEVINPQYGYTTSAKDKGNFRFVRITDINEGGELKSTEKKYVSASLKEIKNYILTKGDLLVARTGSIGRMLYFDSDEPAIFASYLIRLKLDISQISPKYLWLFSHTPSYWGQVGLSASGAVQPQFNANRIKMIKITLPPLKTQQQIIDCLDAIRKAQELNAQQIALANELFQSLLNKELALEGTDRKINKLEEVAEIIMGQSPPSSTYNTERNGLPFLQGKFEFGEIYPIPIKFCSQPLRIAKKNDVLLSVRAPVGPVNLAPSECCIGRGLSAIRAKAEKLDQLFLFYFMKLNEERMSLLGCGSTFNAIGRDHIEKIKISLPSLQIQIQIVEKLQAVQDYKKKLLEQKQKLQELFASCLDKAMKGELVN